MQMNNSFYIIILFILGFYACVESYSIGDQVDFKPLVVVDANITDRDTNQQIKISRSTELDNIEFDGIAGCLVSVSDKNDRVFEFFEHEKYAGIYQGVIPREYLTAGNSFKITIKMPEGVEYESSYEEMTNCAPIDSVYYNVEINNTDGISESGVQFMADLTVNDTYSKYYRWQLEETYEYHATWPIDLIWAGEFINLGGDFTFFTCYKTSVIKRIFLASTQYVSNNYLKYPFHFVNNSTQRLLYKYSLLVKQESITERAYDYWSLMRSNSEESGGLFDKQPSNIEGNIYCLTNPQEKVLGYFGVSAITEKRIFVQDVPGIEFPDDLFCTQTLITDPNVIFESSEGSWPIYLAPSPLDGEEGYYWAAKGCFDCRNEGGSTIKPEFWK